MYSRGSVSTCPRNYEWESEYGVICRARAAASVQTVRGANRPRSSDCSDLRPSHAANCLLSSAVGWGNFIPLLWILVAIAVILQTVGGECMLRTIILWQNSVNPGVTDILIKLATANQKRLNFHFLSFPCLFLSFLVYVYHRAIGILYMTIETNYYLLTPWRY